MADSGDSTSGRVPLAVLLARAVPRPDMIRSKDGSSVLSLALHCLMVEAGFTLLDARGRPSGGPSGFQPQKDWNSKFENEWLFMYSRPGAALRFRLHCSLQAQTQRMFIHASEVDEQDVPLKDNIQVMGLQVSNYVPDPSRLQQHSWDGVIANEHTLADMALEFVVTPLWRQSEKVPDGAEEPASGTSRGDGLLVSLASPSFVLPLAVGVTAAALLYWRRGRLPSLTPLQSMQ